jgi:hypothetical protein
VRTPNCFDRPTTISLDNPWLFFNVEQLSDDPRLETAMSLLIAHATARRASGKDGRRSITVLDECWFLLDSPVLAPEVVQLFRTARKRNASVWGIGQTTENFVGTESKPRVHGAGIVKNTTTKIIGEQPGDMTALREHLHLNDTALNQIHPGGIARAGHRFRWLPNHEFAPNQPSKATHQAVPSRARNCACAPASFLPFCRATP